LRDFGRREATFERWADGADAAVRASAAARVAAEETVVVLVPGDGRGGEWPGAEIVPGVA